MADYGNNPFGGDAVPRDQITSVIMSSPPVFQEPTNAAYDIQVTNPQKQNDKSRAYVSYTLRVKKVADGVESSTYRRFSDFLWIHDLLVTKYPSSVVPPMPEKALTGNFEAALMMYRSRELTRFCQRVASHPNLSRDSDFEYFLTAPCDDFNNKRASTPASPSVVSSIFSSTMKFFGGKVDDTDEWFVTTSAELGTRKDLLVSLQSSATQMVAGWRELSQLYNTQAQQLRALSKFFGDAEASRCEEDVRAMTANVSVLEEFAEHVEHSYLDNISDYVREIAAIQDVLSRRMDLLKDYQSLSKSAEKKGGEMLAKRDDSLRAFDSFSDIAREEIKRVMETRRGELERIVIGLAQMHRDCFTRTGSDWTGALSAVGGADPSAGAAAATSTYSQPADAESAGPFSSAVFDPSSPYATGDD